MISIVMGYYNRLELLRKSLSTFVSNREFEIIIVDDFSAPQHSLNSIGKDFPNLNIRVISMEAVCGRKYYNNPCMTYNVGFSHCSGDKIIIQNPECLHMGDVIKYVDDNLTDEIYMSFNCYAATQDDRTRIIRNEPIPLLNGPMGRGGCWYNHAEYNPTAYHFCSGITRNNLKKLNGFDERYAYGRDYDDNELVQRIKNLELQITWVYDPYVIHQFHGKSIVNKSAPPIACNNKELFEKTKRENKVMANEGKLVVR